VNWFKRLAAATAVAVVTLQGNAAWAGDPQGIIDHAVGTLQDLRHDRAFGNARQLMTRARAILIAPRIFKAGFFFGGEGGTAVLMVRGMHGWSDPAFYTVASGSFGLQVGVTESEMILFVMDQKALDALLRNRFQIGGEAGIAVATLGSTVTAGTTSNLGADIISWASSSGAYVGISLNGTLFEPDRGLDRQFYGRPESTSAIVYHRMGSSEAGPLVHALDALS
jgi:lipid-binding SYLF domain-containing protein